MDWHTLCCIRRYDPKHKTLLRTDPYSLDLCSYDKVQIIIQYIYYV